MNAKVRERAMSGTVVSCTIFFFVAAVFMTAIFGCGGGTFDGTGYGRGEGGDQVGGGDSGGGGGSGAGGGSGGGGAGGWRRLESQHGYFTVELPREWAIKQEDSHSASFSPAGRQFPAVNVYGWMPVPSRNPMQPCQRASAQDFVALIVPFLRQGIPDLQIEQMSPSQPSPQARVAAIGRQGGQRIRSISQVSLEYLLNPAFTLVRGCQAWDAFAFVGTIEAPPGELASLGPIGAHILSTFAPAPRWAVELRTQYFQDVDRQLQMVGRTLGSTSRMQMEQQMSAFETTRRVGQLWYEVLGDPDFARLDQPR